MPTSHENALQQRCQQIVTSPVLSPSRSAIFWHWKQKTICLTPRCLPKPAARWMRGNLRYV